jgi:hypothetical protein
MIVQVVRDTTLGNGIRLKAGAVIEVPEGLAAVLIDAGYARLRVKPGPVETKSGRDIILPPDDLPPEAYVQIPAPPAQERALVPGAYSDRDNFVRNMVTVFPGSGLYDAGTVTTPSPPVTPSGSAAGRPPFLSLTVIKEHLRLDVTATDEDDILMQYEMAARLHTENVLRYTLDAPDSTGENIKQACLLLIGHFYRVREAVTVGKTNEALATPLAYQALLGPERDYPIY